MGLLMGVLWGDAGLAAAQPAPDTVITADQGQELATFEEATALAVDPAGRLYVTDAGLDVVIQLSADGTVTARDGGTGTQPGAFDDPVALDPTNGLALYVADAGNARIQHFARSFQFLEALPVGGSPNAPIPPTYDSQDVSADVRGTGRPVDVAVSGSQEVYAIDGLHGHVIYWDAQRRTRRVIGGFNAGPGALETPVAFALGPDAQLFVADRSRNTIVVYDAFGRFLTTIASGLAADAESLRFIDGSLWLITPAAIQEVGTSGQLDGRWRVSLEAPLLDAARHAEWTYLLTSERLYRMPSR